MNDDRQRHLKWDACFNVRDLGGYPIDGSGYTRWGALVRADNLARLTPEGCRSLVDYGINTIVDLRSPREAEIDLNPFSQGASSTYSVSYHRLSLIDDADPIADAALKAAGTQAENYCSMLDHFSANVAAVVRAVASAEPGGVLVHCHAGKDRTGVVIAVLLTLAGVPRPVVAHDYALSEVQLRPLFEQLYPTIQDPVEKERALEWFRARPETMLTVLAHLDQRHGGVESYLSAADQTDDEIAGLRERLRDPGP